MRNFDFSFLGIGETTIGSTFPPAFVEGMQEPMFLGPQLQAHDALHRETPHEGCG